MARTVIALPGALSGTGPLEAILPELFPAPDCRANARDILNDAPDPIRGFDAWTERFLDSLPPGGGLWLFGYSLGARLALYALRAAPDRWAGATLVSGHPGLTDEGEKQLRREEDETWARRVEQDPWPELLAQWEARPVFSAGLPPVRWRSDLFRAWSNDRAAMEDRRREIAASLRAWSLGRQDNFRPFLGATGIPIHWVTGGCDGKFSGLGKELAATCPALRHTIIPDCGHRVPWENIHAIRELKSGIA